MTFATATIAERIRTARHLRGFSQRAFAKAVGVTQATAWQWESGKAEPRPDSLLKVSQVLHVAMLWLTFGEGPMDAPAEQVVANG